MSWNSRGITLMEMIIVVAIAGILAAVGMANYTSFVTRARTAEAKTNLAAIYAAEKNFFLNNYSYTLCLKQMGFQPAGLPNYYWTGFQNFGANSCGPLANLACNFVDYTASVPSRVCDCAAFVTDGMGTHSDCAWQNILDANPGVALPTGQPWFPTKTTFTAGAQGKISAKATIPDVWVIKQDKILSRPSVGE